MKSQEIIDRVLAHRLTAGAISEAYTNFSQHYSRPRTSQQVALHEDLGEYAKKVAAFVLDADLPEPPRIGSRWFPTWRDECSRIMLGSGISRMYREAGDALVAKHSWLTTAHMSGFVMSLLTMKVSLVTLVHRFGIDPAMLAPNAKLS